MSNQKHIYFIGIGGIGISGLAQIYLEKGFTVSGSDLNNSDLIENLIKRGMKIKIGPHQKENLPQDIDFIIYNLAISQDNPELQEAKKRRIKYLTYPQALGELAKKYFTICISGTHGKTTTTGMVSLILLKAGLDPTVVIGSKLKELDGTNARLGKSKYLVIEADEYKRAFLNYHPDIIVITNIEKDHMDYYRDLRDIKRAFGNFVSLLSRNGFVITTGNIITSLRMSIPLLSKEGLGEVLTPTSSFLPALGRGSASFVDYERGPRNEITEVLQVSGDHNVQNALAAFAVGKSLGIQKTIILKALSSYTGAWRRFEIKYNKEVTVIDDYGHHPTEIRATLKAAREKYCGRRIWCIYQPHQIQRTEKLFSGFTKAFQDVDYVIVTKIFSVSGRDTLTEKTSTVLAQKLTSELKKKKKSVIYLETFAEIIKHLLGNIRKKDVIIVMGAGDINSLTPLLIKKIKEMHL